MSHAQLKKLLEAKYRQYNTPEFIVNDPVSIPHLFRRKQDIEIMGFFAATFAWGQRKTIINKSRELILLFDNAPFDFILHHREKDLKRFVHFKHRTFNADDLLYFIAFFRQYYASYESLEQAFVRCLKPGDENLQHALAGFYELFFSLDFAPARTRKHVPSPAKNSACKRMNMFLRWMVRDDGRGVDFGIWKKIRPAQLLCPLDLHVERAARRLGLLQSKTAGWKAVSELTGNLKKFDADDPVKYDFALFGMSVMEKIR